MKTFDFNFQQIVDAAKDVIIVTKSDPKDPPGSEIIVEKYLRDSDAQINVFGSALPGYYRGCCKACCADIAEDSPSPRHSRDST